MNEYHLKYLDTIQSIISRMASNQFQARAWSVALGSAAIGFAASKDGNPRAAALALLPVFLFWWMDAYFLVLERSYRAMYQEAARTFVDLLNAKRETSPSFYLTPPAMTKASILIAARSPTVGLIHLPIVILALCVATQFFPVSRSVPPAQAQPAPCVCPPN
jgi:hypothetical protein